MYLLIGFSFYLLVSNLKYSLISQLYDEDPGKLNEVQFGSEVKLLKETMFSFRFMCTRL